VRDLSARLRVLTRNGGLSLPPPGAGSTAARHAALFEFGRSDLSLARLAEAHVDALAIFVEAGRVAPVGALYGVWASDGPSSQLKVSRTDAGRIRIDGTKRYCSGAQIVDAALVTVQEGDDLLLLNVPLHLPGITVDTTEWAAPAFSGTMTASVTFDNVLLHGSDLVGPANWYVTRPGFWHGALGPAACWAGGAAGLVDAARALNKRDPHARAQLGALEAADWGLRAVLAQAAREIDADPHDTTRDAQRRALMVRHLIERMCTDVLDRFGRATGPQLLAFDAQIAQRHAELALYIRQCHAERDLAMIPAV
jgi:alkylation response protein AidB-like acyl-CoA dehydrogenase